MKTPFVCCIEPLTGRRIEPAPGFKPDKNQPQEKITVTPDRRNASASFTYSSQVGSPMVPVSTLVAMARLQGEGIVKWWEGGTYEINYVKDTVDSGWKIKRLEYRVVSKADYRPGKSHAEPISVPSFSRVYPEDPTGPDAIATV
ncbi:MAG: nuclear transport factor 2 family protein [Acidobacteriota bacterium]